MVGQKEHEAWGKAYWFKSGQTVVADALMVTDGLSVVTSIPELAAALLPRRRVWNKCAKIRLFLSSRSHVTVTVLYNKQCPLQKVAFSLPTPVV
jgi:hypothetical protein